MLEQDNIQQRDFMNVNENGKIVGFQVPLRSSYYRGVWLSEIQILFEVSVDGEAFKGDQVQLRTGGITYEQKDFQSLGEVYWQVYELAYLIVKKPGGLRLGVYDVGVSYGNTVSYSSSFEIGLKSYKRSLVLCK